MSAPDLAALRPLLAQIVDLKRVRDARGPRSLVERLFGRAWARLAAGEAAEAVALAETAAAVAAVRLGGLDADVMRARGLGEPEALGVLGRSFDDVAAPVAEPLRSRLRDALGAPAARLEPEPTLVQALVDQPRAGATHPGLPRLVLEPAESHADHCGAVAVLGVLCAPAGADLGRVFLCGLAHHLFNVTLPDAGYAADALVGDAALGHMVRHATDAALAALPAPLASAAADALGAASPAELDTPDGRAFQAADVLDRTLEMAWHARAAGFELRDALGTDAAAGELNVNHAGFAQAAHADVLARAGVWPEHGTTDRGGEESSYVVTGHGSVPAASPEAQGPSAEEARAPVAHLERRELGS